MQSWNEERNQEYSLHGKDFKYEEVTDKHFEYCIEFINQWSVVYNSNYSRNKHNFLN